MSSSVPPTHYLKDDGTVLCSRYGKHKRIYVTLFPEEVTCLACQLELRRRPPGN